MCKSARGSVGRMVQIIHAGRFCSSSYTRTTNCCILRHMSNIDNLSKEEFTEIVKRSYNKTELSRNLGFKYCNQRVWKLVDAGLQKYGFGIGHFDARKQTRERRKYEIINKICPVCSKWFETGKGEAKEKTTCSRGCANTHFAESKYTPEANTKRSTTLKEFYKTHKRPATMTRACRVCGEMMPTWFFVDGRRRYLNQRTSCLTCVPYVPAPNRDHIPKIKGTTKIICANCYKPYIQNRKSGGYVYCNSCAANMRRNNNKKWAIDTKGGKCERCGYDKCHRALCFHHTDPSKKEMSVNASFAGHSQKIRQAELDKCILLCANCHMEVHDEIVKKERAERKAIATGGAGVAQIADNG